jgi:hypothetical protein
MNLQIPSSSSMTNTRGRGAAALRPDTPTAFSDSRTRTASPGRGVSSYASRALVISVPIDGVVQVVQSSFLGPILHLMGE